MYLNWSNKTQYERFLIIKKLNAIANEKKS